MVPPMISGRHGYPGLAEKGLKTSSLPPPPHPPPPPRLHRCLPAPSAETCRSPRGEPPHVAPEAERDRDGRATPRALGQVPGPQRPNAGIATPVSPG